MIRSFTYRIYWSIVLFDSFLETVFFSIILHHRNDTLSGVSPQLDRSVCRHVCCNVDVHSIGSIGCYHNTARQQTLITKTQPYHYVQEWVSYGHGFVWLREKESIDWTDCCQFVILMKVSCKKRNIMRCVTIDRCVTGSLALFVCH